MVSSTGSISSKTTVNTPSLLSLHAPSHSSALVIVKYLVTGAQGDTGVPLKEQLLSTHNVLVMLLS